MKNVLVHCKLVAYAMLQMPVLFNMFALTKVEIFMVILLKFLFSIS